MEQELAEDGPSDLSKVGGGNGRGEDGAHHWRQRAYRRGALGRKRREGRDKTEHDWEGKPCMAR